MICVRLGLCAFRTARHRPHGRRPTDLAESLTSRSVSNEAFSGTTTHAGGEVPYSRMVGSEAPTLVGAQADVTSVDTVRLSLGSGIGLPTREAAPLLDGLERFLDEVEAMLQAQRVRQPNSRYAISALGHGLRLRPTLVYLGYNLRRDEPTHSPTAVAVATALELVHRCSVVLDDLADGDTQRRGSLTFHAEHGAVAAALTAFWLLSRANHLVFQYAVSVDLSVVSASALARYYDELGQALANGALGELSGGESPLPLSRCMRIVHQESAVLLSTSLAAGAAAAAETGEPALGAIESIGRRVGMVFQLTNDLQAIEAADAPDPDETLVHWGDVWTSRKNVVASLAFGRMSAERQREYLALAGMATDDAGSRHELLDLIASTGATKSVDAWIVKQRTSAIRKALSLPETAARGLLIDALSGRHDSVLRNGRTRGDLVAELRRAYAPGSGGVS